MRNAAASWWALKTVSPDHPAKWRCPLAGQRFFAPPCRASPCRNCFLSCSFSPVRRSFAVTSHKFFSAKPAAPPLTRCVSLLPRRQLSCNLKDELPLIAAHIPSPPAFLQGKFLNSFIFCRITPIYPAVLPHFCKLPCFCCKDTTPKMQRKF